MIILYLHGFRSIANSGKTQTLKGMFPEHRVIGCDYSPHSPVRAKQQLSDLMAAESLLPESLIPEAQDGIVVIGTSLGGFWARWMAKEFKLKALLINPSLHPDRSLKAGRYEVYDASHTMIDVTDNDLEAFNSSKVDSDSAIALSATVWVAMDDELLDAMAIVSELNDLHDVITFKTGRHRFAQFAEMKSEIKYFIDN